MDSDSGMPAMGLELRAAGDAPPEKTQVQESPRDPQSIRPVRFADEKPRSLIPDWLKFGGRDEAVPLPTTASPPPGAGDPASTGPSEEFS
jgi:hypothetical protein